MILSKKTIGDFIKKGKIQISPTPELKEESVKLHFSESLKIKSKTFALSSTLERIKLSSGIVGFYDGYAKLSQQGIITHLGSMFVDSDTDGVLTLEIFNFTEKDVNIKKGDRSGQLILMEVK